MAGKPWSRSIAGRIRVMAWHIMALLIIPVLVSLVMMVVFSGRYDAILRRMDRIAELKPLISEQIPGAVWSVVSGRETLAASGVDALLDSVNEDIARMTRETGEEDRLSLVIAARTMGTLETYVDRIRENLEKGERVVTNEKVLGEIRDVASLVVSMLNDYITDEIRAASRLSQRLNRAVFLSALGEVLLVVLTACLAGRMVRQNARFIREPIEQLEGVTASLAEGDMRARLPLTQVEELWNLTGQVNIMADRLDAMMRQRVDDERNLKKAELRTLQAQINPHFLYNTLDAIVWKAEAGEQEEVIRLTRALSDFFRISLSSGADWISLAQEKKHISGYLSIQKTRYRDILNYTIDIPDNLGDCYILKLLLQPLVENALYHGIKYRRGGGVITVSARQEGKELLFCVRDTGRGMDAGTLEALRERMARPQVTQTAGQGGFGLVNVNLRIRLYYNQPDGLFIESGPDGTAVSFRVPVRSREEIEHDQSVSGG